MKQIYDVIIIGAGSTGTPAAMALAEKKLSVLVIDSNASPGQGCNKTAIGGIRATHSDPAKIRLGMRSIEIFSDWEKNNGHSIEWKQSGYVFVAYQDKEEQSIQKLVDKQRSIGLEIQWLPAEKMLSLIPGLQPEGLRGGSYSPHDGSASPLLASHAFYQKACEYGAKFRFGEPVEKILHEKGKITGVKTSSETFHSKVVLNAAGPYARQVGKMAGMELPVYPDSHEAAITEPVQPLFEPMIVDIRPTEDSSNYYFYQHKTGQIVFCITPKPNLWGFDTRETSHFLPQVSRRILSIMPELGQLRVRRTWRGLYPMTPDGFPIVDESKELEGMVIACGMCGQGFMLGPGLGELLSRMILKECTQSDQEILQLLRLERSFDEEEELK